MAKGNGDGNDGVDTLVSSIRPGLKREFSLMMKSQAVLMEMGRIRSRSQLYSLSNKGFKGNNGKRFKDSNGKRDEEKEEQKSDVVDDGAVVIEEVDNVEANPVVPMDEEGVSSEMSVRRFTRSLLTTGDEVDIVERDYVTPLDEEVASVTLSRRFTRSLLKPTGDEVDNVEEGNSDFGENAVEVGVVATLDGDMDSGTLLRRFTRSLLKPAGAEVNDVEGNSGDLGQNGVEVTVAPLDVEEASSETPIRRFTRSLLKPTGDQVDDVEGNFGLRGGVEVAVVPLDGEGASSEMPLRRFTRSLLKPTGEASENLVKEDVKSEARTPMPSSSNMGLKTPIRLKELLETGLLEGLSVQYIRRTKARAPGEGLSGLIQGSGILCFCRMCKGTKVVTPNQFELHAASMNKRPPEYIFLENGRTLREVLDACKGASSEILEQTIRQVVGCTDGKGPKQPVNSKDTSASVESVQCVNCKGNELSADQSDNTARSIYDSLMSRDWGF